MGPDAPCPAAVPGKASVALVGFPFDDGCVRNGGRPGASGGPAAFRAAIRRVGVTPHPVSGLDLGAHVDVLDLGDVAPPASCSLEDAHAKLQARVLEALRAGHTPWVIGGGNDQSYPNACALLGALAAQGASLASARVVNIDAHLDVRPLVMRQAAAGRHAYPADEISAKDPQAEELVAHSGSPFRQLLEHPEWRGKFMELGAHALQCAKSHADFIAKRGGEVVWYEPGQTAASARAATLDAFMCGDEQAYKARTATTSGGPPAVFLSFDVDSIQGSDMPSVSCPSPVGLTADEALRHCESAGLAGTVRLVDMSEFNPAVGDAHRSARLCAMMFYHFCLGRARAHARAHP